MKKKLLNGVVFANPLPNGQYLCGRVMLDIQGNVKRRLFPSDSALGLFFGTVLVEMYSIPTARPEYVPSPVLIPGELVFAKFIGRDWPIVGEIPVDLRTVEFPEGVSGFEHPKGEADFTCGEIAVPLPLSDRDCDEINARPSVGLGNTIGLRCAIALGLMPERPGFKRGSPISSQDLRFSKYRPRVYEHLPFPMEISYYDKQKMMGLNLERLYE
jgi:hypothetical protein